MVHVRRMVSFDPVWDPTLVWYERAVGAMQHRPVSDVTSWAYQAAIHGTTRRSRRRSWNSCEHGGWYFFPWHRAYLAGFERIVRAEIVAQGGPADWALPYWDYERPQRSAIPPAFRSPTRPDGKPNALFTTERLSQVNAGRPLLSLIGAVFGPSATLSSAAGLAEATFSTGIANGFGGGSTPSSFQADKPSDIEAFLHGNVHVLVGLGGGFMSAFQTAAQDPVFWLHHANIDRLWATWASKPGHANPTGRWLTQRWTFFSPTGTREQRTPADVVDTVGALDYRYDTLPAPTRAVAEPDAASRVADVGEERELHPVGWTDHVTLTGHEVTTPVPIDRASVARLALPGLDAGGRGQRCYLELSEIDADVAPGILYGVYLHGAGAEASEEALVGVVSFFGAEHTSGRRDRHQHRLRYVFDVTDVLASLGIAPEHGSADVTVSFRPLGPAQVAADEGLDAGEPDAPAVSIGRVALLMG
jgi:hypothetical protein